MSTNAKNLFMDDPEEEDCKDPEDDFVMVDDGSVEKIVVDCESYVQKSMQKQVGSYQIVQPVFRTEIGQSNPNCWNCTFPFQTLPFQIPRSFNENLKKYFVYGNFCSINCAKAYIVREQPMVSSTVMVLFTQMVRTVYADHFKGRCYEPAAPRELLRRFGGPLDIKSYRRKFTENTCYAVEPPFLPSPLVCRESISEPNQNSQSCGLQQQHALHTSPSCPTSEGNDTTEVEKKTEKPGSDDSSSVSAFAPLAPASSTSLSGGLFSEFVKEQDQKPEISYEEKMTEIYNNVSEANKKKRKRPKTAESSKSTENPNQRKKSSEVKPPVSVQGSLKAFINFN